VICLHHFEFVDQRSGTVSGPVKSTTQPISNGFLGNLWGPSANQYIKVKLENIYNNE